MAVFASPFSQLTRKLGFLPDPLPCSLLINLSRTAVL
uniref:Uncharacterized protein n=1 Tax=Rhizophora mucronata TaxID=61149 RepID=A0A2P2QB74_RHIMU